MTSEHDPAPVSSVPLPARSYQDRAIRGLDLLRIFFRRTFMANFQTERATEGERAQLAAAPTPITDAYSPEEVGGTVIRTRRIAAVLNAVGIALLTLYAISTLEIKALDLISMGISVLAGIIALAVVGADFILAMIYAGYRQSKDFHSTELAGTLDAKFETLGSAGLTKLNIDLPGAFAPALGGSKGPPSMP